MTMMHVVITRGEEPSNQVSKNGKQNVIFGMFVGGGSSGESIIALSNFNQFNCKQRRGREHGSIRWVFCL